MLILRPKGRGNWTPITMAIEGARAAPLLVKVGALVTLGGITWRIARILP